MDEWKGAPTPAAPRTTRQAALPQEQAALIALCGPQLGKRFPIETQMIVGRSAQANIVIADEEVSRCHARIHRAAAGHFVVEDLGSRNGTFVNGVPVKKTAELKFGDQLQFGLDTVFALTPHWASENRLIEQQKLESIGRLAASVAHEFNNALSVVRGNIGHLRSRSSERTIRPSELSECFDDVDSALGRAAELTRQLMGFARQGSYKMSPVDMQQVVADVIRLARHIAGDQIQLATQVKGDTTVLGDQLQLQQMLMNIVLNAIDAMPHGGDLSVAVERRQGEHNAADAVMVAVTDTGAGMTESIRRRIFEPFFTTKPAEKGSGLGLAAVYGVVAAHGGQIDVESEPGGGSTFTIRLPVAAPSLKTAAAITVDAHPIVGGTVLVIDDDPLVLRSNQRQIEGFGLRVLTANGGREGVEKLIEHRNLIQLVVLDLHMPGIDGETTLRMLRAIAPDIDVLIVSAAIDDDHRQRLIDRGVLGFLTKPCSNEALRDQISKALGRQLKTD